MEAMDEEKWDFFVGRLGAEQPMKHEIEHKNEIDYQFFSNLPEFQVVGEDYSFPSDADSDLLSSSDEGRESEKVRETEETFSDSKSKLGSQEVVSGDPFCGSDEEYIELELQTRDLITACAEIPPLEDSKKLKKEDDRENSAQEINRREEPSAMSCDEGDEPEILPEHESVIEQLKRELRTRRTGGLPTIWEEGSSESESSITIQGLKPLKIDQKYERNDQMEEIHKVYKAYEGKMRKLDVLNNQTIHAIDLLQLKNQKRSIWSEKSFIPHNFWPRKLQKSAADSSLKVTGNLLEELELVYAGQVCLSWEILNWQHRKVLELQEHDPEGLDQGFTNQAATHFQTFQIFMERFVESDQFHGSRVENYVKNRYFMRRFLQVPAINGGCLEEKNRTKSKYGDFSGNQAEMIEDSMRIFREFIRSDKDDGLQAQTDLEDPTDLKLLNDTRAVLQKKEKKLKDIARSKKCIVKKLQQSMEGKVKKEDTLLVAEVELKLVSRVLRLSKLSKSQLQWCCQKLSQVVFFKGKLFVEVEPNFLLFPF